MIPKEELLKVIEAFYTQYEENKKDLINVPKEDHLDYFLKWYEMTKAWVALQDVIEFELLPFVEDEVKK